MALTVMDFVAAPLLHEYVYVGTPPFPGLVIVGNKIAFSPTHFVTEKPLMAKGGVTLTVITFGDGEQPFASLIAT